MAFTQPSPNKDSEVSDSPPDSISCLAFSPAADYLAAGSWDCNVRIYEVAANGQTQGKALYNHEGPVLDICWTKDGSKVISASVDKTAKAYDLGSGQSMQMATHSAPVKCCRWVEAPSGGYLVTGSWDKTIKYWNFQSSNPIATVDLPERCYALDVAYPLMVVGTAERHVVIIDLNNPQTIYKVIPSPLKWQTRCIACFPTADGFAVGSVEGRVAIHYIPDKDSSSNFSFKCHRKEDQQAKKVQVFSVNCTAFNTQHGTFATAGSDGTMFFWDKDQRCRLKSFDPSPGPITAIAFNRSATIFAYAISYDWSKGHAGVASGAPNKIMLHSVVEDEIKKKPGPPKK